MVRQLLALGLLHAAPESSRQLSAGYLLHAVQIRLVFSGRRRFYLRLLLDDVLAYTSQMRSLYAPVASSTTERNASSTMGGLMLLNFASRSAND